HGPDALSRYCPCPGLARLPGDAGLCPLHPAAPPRARRKGHAMIADISLFAGGTLLLVGALFVLLATIGVLRLPDLYTRMHAASKAGAVGGGFILLAVALISLDT